MTDMPVIPCGNMLLVKILPFRETRKGGKIVVCAENSPEFMRETAGRDVGRIIAIGPCAFKGENCSSPEGWGLAGVGDYVQFGKYDGAGLRFTDDEEKWRNYQLVPDYRILAKLSPELVAEYGYDEEIDRL